LRIDSPDLSETVKQLIGGADEGCLENVFSDKMDSTFRDSVANFFIGACIFDWVRVSIWLNRFPHSTCWSNEDDEYWSDRGKEDVETVMKTLSDAYRKFEAEIQSEMMRTGWCPPSYYTILGYAILLDCSDHESLTNVIRRLQAAGNKLRTIYFSTKIDELALTVPSIAASLKHHGTVVDLFRGRHLLWTEGGLRGISCPGVETHCDQKSVLAVVDGMSFPVIVQDYEKETGEGWLDGFAVICGVDMLNQDTVKAVLPLGFQRGEKTIFKFGTGVEREKTESHSPPELTGPSGRTFIPLHHAAKFAQFEEVRRLLDASEPVDERAGDGSTALHYAVHWSGSFDICALLLQRGANPNAQRSTDGFAPLHELVSSSYRKDRWAVDFLDELYAHGADIHLRAFEQQSVLGLAACQNLATCIRRLIDLGAHPDSPLQWYSSNSGFGTGFRSALGIAAWHAHIETMRVLIDGKADVNYNDFGQTPLLEIVCNRGASNDPNRYVEGARMLLDAGADINIATTKGSGFITPLGRALYNGNVELTRLLIKRGADPNIINSNNESPLSMARRGEHAPIIKGGNAEMIKFAETLPLSQ
jgi:ankyrin repeat protein